MFVEPIETLAPETTIEIKPYGCRFQTFLIEPAAPESAMALLADEGSGLQHAQMPRNRRQGNRKGARQFRHRRFARRKALNDGAPCWVGKRGKGPVEARR